MSAEAPAGWYPDRSGNERFWDGFAWTDSVRAPNPAPRVNGDEVAKTESMFSKLKRVAVDKQAAKRAEQDEIERRHAAAEQAAGALLTSGVFGTSTVEIYEGGYVRVAVGERELTEPKKITNKTPYEKLRSIRYAGPAEDKDTVRTSGLDGVVGSAVSTLFKGGAGLMKGSVPGLAVAGVAHLASAEGRRAYLTVATDRAIHNLTNESHNGMLVRSIKGHNEIGAELAQAGMSVLGHPSDAGQMPAESVSGSVATSTSAVPTLSERLREMAELHKDGILSAEEFADAKAKLLSGL